MITLNVDGMHCKSCEMLVGDELEENGATNVVVDHKKGIVKFDNMEKDKAIEIIKKEGYKVRK